jgi:peptide/nickel transport system permease protein
MLRRLSLRLVLAVALVWAAGSLAFVMTQLAPGDAALAELGPGAVEAREALRARLGLDAPLSVRYQQWLTGVVQGSLGHSVLFERPVGDVLRERTVNTAALALAALLVGSLLGVPLGVYSGTHPSAFGTRCIRGASALLVSMPSVLLALVLVLVSARTGWLPVGGMTGAAASSLLGLVIDRLSHLTVPALALALPLAAMLEHTQAQAMADVSSMRVIDGARARGLSRRAAVWRHAWPLSLGTVLPVYGVLAGSLFGGAVAVEAVTAWPGLGRLMIDAVRARDAALLAGAAMTATALLAVITQGIEALAAWRDPRTGTDA